MQAARIRGIADRWVKIVRLEIAGSFEFMAGQYLEVLHPGGTRIPLSIASAPHRLPEVELHYRAIPGDALAPLFEELLELGADLDIAGPFGEVTVSEPAGPLLLAAGGTGSSQALAIIEHLQSRQRQPATTLLWCADQADAFYARERLERLAWLETRYAADARRTSANEGLQWLGEHLEEREYDRVLLCGGPPFVYAIVDHLKALGLDVPLESDVFGYSPRG